MLHQSTLVINTSGQGLYEFTRDVVDAVRTSDVSNGLLTLFCRHTSCSLVIQENADPDVRVDMEGFFSRLVPEGMDWIIHTQEGLDDMPAHIKTALTATTLSIPVMEGRPVLGTWQGVYLFEHRTHKHSRHIVIHLSGE